MLVVDNLTIENNQHCLLKDACFTLRQGECVAIIGASGSGKSILANALLSSLPAGFKRSGRVELTSVERSLVERASSEHRSIAIVAQGAAALNPSTKVGPQIQQKITPTHNFKRFFSYFFGNKALSKDKLNKAVKQAKLTIATLPLYPHQLSGGMAKRALAAMALVQDTDFIIADEPTCGLETAKAEAVFAELASLRFDDETKRKKGILIISHDLPGVIEQADRILVLKDGQIVDETTPCAIKQGLAAEYTLALWQASPQNWIRKAHAQAS